MARGATRQISRYCLVISDHKTRPGDATKRAKFLLASKMIMKLWALWALAGTASALFPVIVPMSDNANDTLLTWGPVTADISANRCRAFAVAFDPPEHARGVPAIRR